MKILIDENIPMGASLFGRYGDVKTFSGRTLQPQDTETADAMIIRSITRISESLLKNSPVKFLGTATIGTDHVDQAFLQSAGIHFSSAPGCNSNSVGEYFTSAMLHLAWENKLDLGGKTLGIIGYGNVGKNVARKAATLGLKILKNDPPLDEKEPGQHDLVPLSALQENADIITCHVPLEKTGRYPTLHLADRRFFSEFKKPITFMNTSRGQVIRGQDVIDAKNTGNIRNLILDVFPDEPGISPELVLCCDIATPHIAGYSVQGKLNGTTRILRDFCGFFNLPYPEKIGFPLPDSEDILPVGESEKEILYKCVSHAYPIMEDDASLRGSLLEKDPSSAFDRLRKTYGRRFEFPCYRIKNPDKSVIPKKQLAEFGFRVS